MNCNVGVRVRPSFDSYLKRTKFGMSIENGEVESACSVIARSKYLDFKGFHIHLGTQQLGVTPYLKAIEMLVKLAERVLRSSGLQTEVLDLGGGFPASGIREITSETKRGVQVSLRRYAAEISKYLQQKVEDRGLLKPMMIVEPGRAIVSSPVILLTKVVAKKNATPARDWIIVDAGLNVLPEAEYYVHQMRPSVTRTGGGLVNVAGPLCMAEDCLGFGRRLGNVKEGDIIAVLDAGAYSLSLSWQFVKPRPAVCLLHRDKVKLIRRRETIRDVLSLDLPSTLKYRSCIKRLSVQK